MRHYGTVKYAFNQPTPPVGRHVPDVPDGFDVDWLDGQIEESKEQQAQLVPKPKHQNPKPVCIVCTGHRHGPYQTDGPQGHRGESAPKATRHQSGSQECTGSRRVEKSSSISSGFVFAFALYSLALNVVMHHHPHVTTPV